MTPLIKGQFLIAFQPVEILFRLLEVFALPGQKNMFPVVLELRQTHAIDLRGVLFDQGPGNFPENLQNVHLRIGQGTGLPPRHRRSTDFFRIA